MFKFLRERKKDNKGFTLVELVIVVAILAILVGILAPQYTKYVEKSRKAADASNLENLVTAFKTVASDGNDQIKAGTYKIAITGGTNGAASVTVTNNGTDKATVESLIGSYAGTEWTKTKLKSSKWTKTAGQGNAATTNTVSEISATITVDNDGAVSVDYDPTTIKDQTNK